MPVMVTDYQLHWLSCGIQIFKIYFVVWFKLLQTVDYNKISKIPGTNMAVFFQPLRRPCFQKQPTYLFNTLQYKLKMKFSEHRFE
jgi:hypothetical protein